MQRYKEYKSGRDGKSGKSEEGKWRYKKWEGDNRGRRRRKK